MTQFEITSIIGFVSSSKALEGVRTKFPSEFNDTLKRNGIFIHAALHPLQALTAV